ncbi:MAG: hypothetical protein KGI80_06170 [Verrucomicrobiota bacterium]|nr:hypothetical protein [Verrucomicrobiota bacterium]
MTRWTRCFFLLCFAMHSFVFAQTPDADFSDKADPDARDMDALRRWVRDKRFITMKEVGGDLSLSGEVRTEFQATNERLNGIQQRDNPGVTGGRVKPMYAWDVEFNLMLDYRRERTWAALKVEFDNDMGLRSGTVNKVSLEKAYLGGRVIEEDTFIMDAELGRRYFFHVYDSKVEFGALYDGFCLRVNKAFEQIGSFYFNGGAFLTNDFTNHYGWVGELGALDVANTGVYLKYSLIDWYRPGGEEEPGNTVLETALTNQRFRFLVSQLLAYYQTYPNWIGKRMIKCYAAGLVNHIALSSNFVETPKGRVQIIPTGGKKANIAWYAGVAIGVVKKARDWAVDVNYQWVQAQAYPSFDNTGIGRGNSAGLGLYTVDADGSGGPTTQETAGGNTNFKGFLIEALYALTDNLTVQQYFRYSNTLDANIGPNEKYRQYEIEFVFAF